MASKKEIKKHLKLALKEIGEIKPWYSKEFKAWIFSHDLYPVEYAGDTEEEVIQNFPIYLEDFIKERLANNLADIMEEKTKGRGGKRAGAGRPKSSTKMVRIYVPEDLAQWLKTGNTLSHLKELYRSASFLRR